MRKLVTLIIAVLALSAPVLAGRRGYTSRTTGSRSYSTKAYTSRSYSARSHGSSTTRRARISSPKSPTYRRTPGVTRDREGRIQRSAAAKRQFRQSHPCPSTGRKTGACPGYEVDHRVPLYKGGADSQSNMQWLSDEQHKAKHDKR